ncbi:hypothetical protein EMMF5_006459 [Cystobasidiomycetes sp. EMM_F5]
MFHHHEKKEQVQNVEQSAKEGEQQHAQPAPQPAPEQHHESHHYGKQIGGGIAKAAQFGFGATLGADAANSIVHAFK